MTIYASQDNLDKVQHAITELVEGKRQVKVEYVTSDGFKNAFEYAPVNLTELRNIERALQASLNPIPTLSSIEVEIVF
ncbi:gpW family head-tail joining protein [Vibrio sp. La 4.2.2]|uniref:gpW family head-tail joining protein n=1 Tax=Vibrio sp. La 4.2.2 TaxID=2998830 RepID=UPI0022CDE7F2|nr:gpW family head-tail joining protein [Vibrio sp. La 4.2.2]MDA0107833.1 gpW family head-tail joining protein [Vibrio sp. La 4.2.2]